MKVEVDCSRRSGQTARITISDIYIPADPEDHTSIGCQAMRIGLESDSTMVRLDIGIGDAMRICDIIDLITGRK